jgi:phospholipid/cholesterol/gamma-HCH transport system permease protein
LTIATAIGLITTSEQMNSSIEKIAAPASSKYLFSKGIDQYFIDVYKAYKFTTRFFKELFKAPLHFREIINQSFEVGLRSLSLITVTGFIIGIVFTKQSRPSLEDFGATSWLPSLIGIAIVRALGPLVTALICAGKVGSSIGAELGSMKVTEQIDAMEVSAINPYKYLVVTRVLATTITVPILALYCSFVGLLGSYVNVHGEEATSLITFYKEAFSTLSFLDIFSSVAKATIFGFTIGIIGCYKGFHAQQGTRGVGKAANQAVVLSMFLVFLEEVVIVQISNWMRTY